MRKTALGLVFFVLVVAICAAVVLYMPRRYSVTRSQMASTAYWSDTDLFITVQTTAYARAEVAAARRSTLLQAVFALTGGNDFVVLPAEFSLYHFDGHKLDRGTLPGADFVVPVGKTLCFVEHKQNSERQVWSWRDGALAPVTGEERAAALKAFENAFAENDEVEDRPELPDGWHRTYLYAAKSKKIDVPLHGGTATLMIRPAPRDERNLLAGADVTLSAPSLASPVTLVVASASGTREISKSEFAALRAHGSTPFNRLGWLRSSLVLAEYLVLLLLPFSPLIVSVLRFLTLKRKLLANLPTDATFPNALPSQFPSLDQARLEALTRDLENLGFTHAIDYTLVSSMAMQIPAFARLMTNASAGCFAEINQVFPPGKKIEMAINFLTRFEGWQASTTTRKPNGGNWILRLPRSVWQCKPGLSAGELLQAHRQLCEQMAFELGIGSKPARTADDWFRDIREGCIKRRSALQNKSLPVILLEFHLFKLRPKLEWKGDWPKESRKKMEGFAASAVTRS